MSTAETKSEPGLKATQGVSGETFSSHTVTSTIPMGGDWDKGAISFPNYAPSTVSDYMETSEL